MSFKLWLKHLDNPTFLKASFFSKLLYLGIIMGLSACVPILESVSQNISGSANLQAGYDSWAGSLIYPSLAKRQEACNLGYQAGQANLDDNSGILTIETLTGPVAFQSVFGSTYNVCKSAALDLDAQPTGLPLLTAYVIIYKNGASFFDSIDWQAKIVVLDANNQELIRLEPSIAEYNQKLKTRVFGFEADKLSFLARDALSKAHHYQLLINRGSGFEAYGISQEAFPDLK